MYVLLGNFHSRFVVLDLGKKFFLDVEITKFLKRIFCGKNNCCCFLLAAHKDTRILVTAHST